MNLMKTSPTPLFSLTKLNRAVKKAVWMSPSSLIFMKIIFFSLSQMVVMGRIKFLRSLFSTSTNIEFTTYFHEFSKHESTNFLNNISQLKKEINFLWNHKYYLTFGRKKNGRFVFKKIVKTCREPDHNWLRFLRAQREQSLFFLWVRTSNH